MARPSVFVRLVGSAGTVLERTYAELLTGAKIPHGPRSFGAYAMQSEA
ncbi:hypothetical protein [Dactylosporangium sp. NPDC051484]